MDIKRVPPGGIIKHKGRYYHAGDILPKEYQEEKQITTPPLPVVELKKEEVE